MSEPADAVALIDRFVAAWLRGDLAAVTDCLAADVVYSDTGRKGVASTYRGRDEVAAAFADQLGDDPDLTLGAVIATGDRAYCEWVYAGAADGTTLRGIDVYTLKAGKIAAKDVFAKVT